MAQDTSKPSELPRAAAIGLRVTLTAMGVAVLVIAAGTYGTRNMDHVLAGVAILGLASVASGIAILVNWHRVDWLLRAGCAGFIASGVLVLVHGTRLMAAYAG